MTVAANVVAMSVYLWHMTAAVLVAAVVHLVGLVPTAAPGSGAWWSTKPWFLVLNLLVLIPIVRRVAPVEQRALTAGRATWRWGTASILVVAALLSAAVKTWSSPNIWVLLGGVVAMLCIWWFLLSDRSKAITVDT
jgi:hypothetical protein